MLTQEENEELTRVGPGTPAGELLRRYWHPVAASIELAQNPVKKVRLLCEDLALFRDSSGHIGLVADRCPHRSVALSYGFVDGEGLRCLYHGWQFDTSGNCIDQPNELPTSHFKERTCVKAYPVEELGGLVFAYLGPEPVPLLPRWHLFAEDGRFVRQITETTLPCNWLQIMENSVDPVHNEWAHGNYMNYILDLRGVLPWDGKRSPHTAKIGFDEFEHGIIKRRMYEGRTEEHPDWAVGHPMVFPLFLYNRRQYQIRIPIDDTHTWHLWYKSTPVPEGVPLPDQSSGIPVRHFNYLDDDGRIRTDSVNGQDIAAWLTQGPIADRTIEALGSTDIGMRMLRKMYKREIDKVARGEDPLNTFRDPEANQCIVLPDDHRERDKRADLAKKGDAVLASGIRAFHPEGWSNDPAVQEALDAMGLVS